MPSLWIALRLPKLPLEALSPQADLPCVVFERSGNRRQVLCTNEKAAAAGITSGMALGAATALAPELQALERKPAAERAALAALAATTYRFSGSVTLRPIAPAPRVHTLWLEIGSSLRLFGGLAPLLEQLQAALGSLDCCYQLGVAPTPEGASLLADARHKPVLDPTALGAALHGLSLDLLEIHDDIQQALRGSGLRTISEVLALPINELAMRFGQPLSDYLGQVTGRVPEARKFFRLPDRYRRRFEFDAELENFEALLFPIRRMLVEFQQYLVARDTGVREFTFELEHEDGKPTRLDVRMGAASRDATHLQLLLRERLERAPMPAPVRALVLRAEHFCAPRVLQRALFESKTTADEEWQGVLDRLRARLGPEAVHSLGLNDDYRPEKSWCHQPPDEKSGTFTYFDDQTIRRTKADEMSERPYFSRQRPLWLLPVPRPLRGIPKCVSGPERLEGGWWDGLDATRDYYQAQTDDGARLWVYRDRRNGSWFLQGLWG